MRLQRLRFTYDTRGDRVFYHGCYFFVESGLLDRMNQQHPQVSWVLVLGNVLTHTALATSTLGTLGDVRYFLTLHSRVLWFISHKLLSKTLF